MEENTKVAYAKNLNKLSFNQTLNIPIDANANVKNVMDVNTYLFDLKVECGNGKAVVSGKLGVKVMYLDTDNMTNSVSESQTFSETYVDASVTADTFLNVLTHSISHEILDTSSSLKINCDVNILPVMFLNLNVSSPLQENEMLVTKKSEIQTNSIVGNVNTNFEYFVAVETSNSVNKILCSNSHFTPEKLTALDGFAVVEGKMCCSLVYETNLNDEIVLKEIKETQQVKCDLSIDGLKKDTVLDFSFMVDKSKCEVTTETEDNKSLINIKNVVCVNGAMLTPVKIEIVDDMFSTTNTLETTLSTREYTKNAEHFHLTEVVANEINLNTDEPAVDEIIANLNANAEITNTYIKDNYIYVEGVTTSNLTYIDENKEYRHKELISPFIVNTKIPAETLGCVHSHISVVDTRVKVKRGTIIETENTLYISMVIYEKETHEMVDNYTLGKALDLNKYDYQIFLSKPNETLWELCKRIKISPNDIHKYNKDLPLIMEGNEKVIIKR